MSTLPGTSCLLTDLDDLYVPARPAARASRRPHLLTGPVDPGDDAARRATYPTGKRAVICHACGTSLTEEEARRSKSGKIFCLICADDLVQTYYRTHPEARPTEPPLARERTGTRYLNDGERYEVRYHARHARWQISDTQTRCWSSQRHATEDRAQAAAAAMNAAWREQIALERRAFASAITPSTSPRHTWQVGERAYGREE